MAIELRPVNTAQYLNGSSDIEITFNSYAEYQAKQNSTDWIGVYKKEASTDWENVLTWAWVKDLPGVDVRHLSRTFSDTHFTEPGEYEVRYFENNSYDIEKSISFTIKEVESHLFGLKVSTYADSRQYIELKGFDGKNIIPDEKDWVGIYKKNDDNTWDNVIQWAWAKDLKDNYYLLRLNLDKLEKGVQYEARYFLNNSFTTYKKTEPFYAGELPEDQKPIVRRTSYYNGALRVGLDQFIRFNEELSKTWVGVFKKDATYKNNENLIAWTYVNEANRASTSELEILKPELLINGEEYQTVYFNNDSYKQLGKTLIFTLEGYK
jgi:hypothetical protein